MCYYIVYILRGVIMEFKSRSEVDLFIKSKRFKYIDGGAEGECFLDTYSNTVYKIFHSYFYDEKCFINEDRILKYSNIINNTFIWPNDVILCEGKVIGYTSIYKKAYNLHKINPLMVNLDKYSDAISLVYSDVYKVSSNNILLNDIRYNILYYNSNIYIIDTLDYINVLEEYSFPFKNLYRENCMMIDRSLILFLVDGFFDDFVKQDSNLMSLYSDRYSDAISFISLFRKRVSEYVGHDVKYLKEASSLVCRDMDSKGYVRLLRK